MHHSILITCCDGQAKLSVKGDGSDLQCVWAGNGLLAAANREPLVRVWQLEQDANYVLPLSGSVNRVLVLLCSSIHLSCSPGPLDARHMAQPKDTIRIVAFNPRKRVLAGGTSLGRVCLWRFVGSRNSEPSENDWIVLPPVNLGTGIASLVWGMELLCVSILLSFSSL